LYNSDANNNDNDCSTDDTNTDANNNTNKGLVRPYSLTRLAYKGSYSLSKETGACNSTGTVPTALLQAQQSKAKQRKASPRAIPSAGPKHSKAKQSTAKQSKGKQSKAKQRKAKQRKQGDDDDDDDDDEDLVQQWRWRGYEAMMETNNHLDQRCFLCGEKMILRMARRGFETSIVSYACFKSSSCHA
jgi:hypothetical protein